MKTCARCSTDKPYTEFNRQASSKDGYGSYCVSCKNDYSRQKSLTSAEHRANRSKAVLKWMRANKELANRYRKTYLSKPVNKIKRNLRKRIQKFITEEGVSTRGIKCSSVGCSRKELKAHLEQRFQPGMNWDNYGEWHVDHIKPLCLFNLLDPLERRAANLYTNLQPLWAEDNISKGNKYTAPQTFKSK